MSADECSLAQLIEADLGRTFPSLALFDEQSPMRLKLREMLWIYVNLPHGLPYTQGMSHLAATLLLHFGEPSAACPALHVLVSTSPVLQACLRMETSATLHFFDLALSRELPTLGR